MVEVEKLILTPEVDEAAGKVLYRVSIGRAPLSALDEFAGRAELAGLVAQARRCGEQIEAWEVFLASRKPKDNFRRRIGKGPSSFLPETRQDETNQTKKEPAGLLDLPPTAFKSDAKQDLMRGIIAKHIHEQDHEVNFLDSEEFKEETERNRKALYVTELTEGEDFEPSIEEKLIVLPGIAGELQDYYLRTAMRPGNTFSLAPALIVPTVLVSEKVVGPSGSKGCCLQLYLIALGPSTSGKQEMLSVPKEALIKCGRPDLIGPSRFKSGPAFYRLFKEKKSVLSLMDEYGKFVAKISSEKALECEKEILDRIKDLWGLKPGEVYVTDVGAKEDADVLYDIHLSILGTGIPQDFYTACKSKEIVDGTLNRHLIIEEKVRPPRQRNPSTEEFPKSLIDGLKKLASIEKTRLGWDKGAEDLYEAEVARIEALTNETEANLWGRGPEQMVRLSSVLACCRLSKTIQRGDMEIAHEVVARRSQPLLKDGINHAAKDKILDHAETVRAVEGRIRDEFNGSASLGDLRVSFRRNKKHRNTLQLALDDLVESQTLKKELVKTGGRNKYVYRFRREDEAIDEPSR